MDHNNKSIQAEQGKVGAGGVLLMVAVVAIIGFFIYPSISLQKGEEGEVKATAPSAIRDLSGEPGDAQVSLAWSAPEDGGSPITGYLVSYSGNKESFTDTTNSTSYTAEGLLNGVEYSFSVASENEIGISEYSSSVLVTPVADEVIVVPGAVTKLAGEGEVISGVGYINLTWTAPVSDGGFAITGYSIEYSGDGVDGVKTIEVAPDETSHTLGELSPAAEYVVSVYATNKNGNSDPAEINVMIPVIPGDGIVPFEFSTDPEVSSSDSGATITWGTSKSSASQVSYGATDDLGQITQKINTTPMVKGHTVTLSNLLPCTAYVYKVMSFDQADNMIESIKGEFKTSGCKGNAEIIVNEKGKSTAESGVTLEAKQSGRGLSVVVPPAVKSGREVAIQASIVSKDEVISEISKPSGKTWVGKSYVLSAIEDSTTEVTSFDKPVTVSIDYQNADIEGVDPDTLKIWHYEDGARWRELSSCTTVKNGVGGTVICDTTSFSIFGIFGEEGSGGSSSSGGGSTSSGSVPVSSQSNQSVDSDEDESMMTQTNENDETQESENQETLAPTAPTMEGENNFKFTKNLWQQIKDMEVKKLQEFLNQKGFAVSESGPGSPGQETDFFGPKTKEALIRFQEAYKANILTPIGLNLGTGFFGPMTRDFINSL